MEGGEDPHLAPFKAPTTPQPPPPLCCGRGTPFEESTFHVTPPVAHEEGVQHLSLLRFMLKRDTQHTEGESCSVMSGRCGHTVPVFSVEDGLTDQTAVLCSISCLLYS